MAEGEVILPTGFSLIARKLEDIRGQRVRLEVDVLSSVQGPRLIGVFDVEGTVRSVTVDREESPDRAGRRLSASIGSAVVHLSEADMQLGSWNRLEGTVQFRCAGLTFRISGADSELRNY